MKPLPPTIREKKRYLKFKIHAEEDVEYGEVVDTIWSSALDYMGSKNCGTANHWVIKNQFSEEDQEGVIKVERSSLEDFRTSISLIDSLGEISGFVEIKEVSGSIKKLQTDR